MLKKFRQFLSSDPKNAPLVVELTNSSRPEPPSKELRDSVLTLRFHPGFQWLQANKRFQRAVLEAKLHQEKHDNLREVDRLQAMIAVLNWDAHQIEVEAGRSETSKKPASLDELDLFKQISSSIELIS